MSLAFSHNLLHDDDKLLFGSPVTFKRESFVPFIFTLNSACRLSDHQLITVTNQKFYMYHPVCDNPTYIISPNLVRDITYCDKLVLDKVIHDITPQERGLIFEGESFYRVFHQRYIDFKKMSFDERHELMEKIFLMDSSSGEVYDVFVEVPCGKCELCIAKKVASYMQRCQFAVEESKRVPYFVTLTYNDEHLPSDGVSKRHLQLFFKRLRRTLELNFCAVHDKVKFLLSSEYTPVNHRPHYHLLIFGLPRLAANDTDENYEINYLVNYCWRETQFVHGHLSLSFGEYKQRYPKIFKRPKGYDSFSYGYVSVEKALTCSAVGYILKYSLKYLNQDENAPNDKNPNFYSCSKNLGLQWLKQFAPEIKNGKGKFTYVDIFNEVHPDVSPCAYYFNKLFPNYSKLVPVELRKAVRFIKSETYFLCQSPKVDPAIKSAALATLVDVNMRFPFLAYELPFEFPCSILKKYPDANVVANSIDLIMSCYEITRLPQYEIDFTDVLDKLYQRELILTNFSAQSFPDVAARRQKFVRGRNDMIERQVLL